MIESRPSLSNSSRIREHANSSLELGKISSGNYGRGLIVDSHLRMDYGRFSPQGKCGRYLESSGAPVDELNGSLSLNERNGRIDVFWNDVPSIEKTASHVLSIPGITFNHLEKDSVVGRED